MLKITKKGKKAWVTFTAPVTLCETVHLKGSWNDWKPEVMKRKKDGTFYLTKIFPVDSRYEFGYLIDESDWVHDPETELADTPFGSKNSILAID